MHGPKLRKLKPIIWEEALDSRGEEGEVPKKARVDVVGGAVDEADDVVSEKLSAHSYLRYVCCIVACADRNACTIVKAANGSANQPTALVSVATANSSRAAAKATNYRPSEQIDCNTSLY